MDDAVRSEAGIPLDASYGPADLPSPEAIPPPGTFPFTRGNFPDGYRGRLWTIRQYSGFGTPEESNARYRYLLEQGGTGLSVALDLPTQCGYDSDHPDVEEEVGRVGVALDTLADVEILFDQIPLDAISTSFTINGTAAIVLAFYVAAAEKRGVDRTKLRGTIQNDILKEYVSRGTWIWPPRPSLRLIADTIEFCAEEVPRFNAISVAGAHFRDAGANAVQEMAFTLMDGITYCDEVVARGRMTIDEFAPQVSFFFYTHGDFFEEIAKYRAGRRRWAHIVRERYGANDDRSCMFRVGCVAGGASLYAPQAHNNIVRVAYEALASVLGGVQSMFTAAWDEPFALPSEDSATLALRTQQVLASETGVARVADPLGGSYYVEALTDEVEARVVDVMDDLERRGGMVKAVEDGYLHRLIADESFRLQQAVTSGDRQIVGVNRFQTDEVAPETEGYELDEAGRARQLERLAAVKSSRSASDVGTTLDALGKAAAQDDVNLMPLLVDCAQAYCTLGEMVDVLKREWGEFVQPTVF
ncbi:MAG TPA: methylmalonyl-CoA mutase family protein [Acidimicrobiia bacterium]|nr:methylmalonyl-CoA mutase family protein [Acidimicrobiia bacterium]